MSSMLAVSLMLAASYADAAQLVKKHKHNILSEIAVVESGIVQIESNRNAAFAINSISYEVSQLPFCLDVCLYCSDAIAQAEINSNAVVAIAETQQKAANAYVARNQCQGNDLAKSQAQTIVGHESSLSQMLACNSLVLCDLSALDIVMLLRSLYVEKLAMPDITSIRYSPFMFGQSSVVFPLDSASRWTALQQSNSSRVDPMHSYYLDASAIPCIFSKSLDQVAAYGDYIAVGQASFSSFAYNEDQQLGFHNGIRPISTFNQDASQMAFSYESISYGQVSITSIDASYANMLINTSFQNAISKTKTKNIFGVSELDLMSMTRQNDVSWLSIPMQCRFRALQKIENGEDPTEELRIAAMWQEKEEDQMLALETNKYVVSMSAIVNMRQLSSKSSVVVGFNNALDQVEILLASIKLDGKQLEVDEDLARLAVKKLKQKNLMANVVMTRVYSYAAQTTFTIEVAKQL